MDYSSLPNDPDLPAGTSPWQSSPQRPNRRSDSMSEAGSVPSSPLAKHSPYRPEPQQLGEEGVVDQETFVGGNGGSRGERAGNSSAPAQNGSTQRTPGGDQSSPTIEQSFQGRQQPQQSPSQQNYQPRPQQQQQYTQQQQQRAAGPNRYHSGARPTARQALPQYRLQAKVTGLERTGRKDPAVRFDVYVSSMSTLCQLWSCLIQTDKST